MQRARTGVGAVVDVSIHDAALAWSMFPETAELANACYNVYETADGEWLALGALEPKFWQGFCERIDRADLVPLQHAQGAERERVVRDVRDVMRARTRGEWLARFADADVCLTTIYTPAEVASDPHVIARGAMRRAAAAPGARRRYRLRCWRKQGSPADERDRLRAAARDLEPTTLNAAVRRARREIPVIFLCDLSGLCVLVLFQAFLRYARHFIPDASIAGIGSAISPPLA